ncbi:DUF1028 domain-containing protein [Aminobacter anthyllidis]|uniref:DUF1028 domain-containing protein n=1 Tax=Aminobacter anthyllidis TaxID=1035067 RepID=A0A9X1D940_9HYPH|nr:DUF1028 domain-containing protein [Aminobacter anthyllidis]MBT1159678.1 DUF1028 domain-containing protein [Aminobacter anthyllidis]
MTFSIVARCASSGMFGAAVSSSSPAVAARCAFARSGIGAFVTQNFTDPSLGQRGLELMQRGATAAQAIDIVSATAEYSSYRQLAAIGPEGAGGTFTGTQCMPTTAFATGIHSAAVGNLLASDRVPAAMVAAFEAASGHIGGRLVAAMHAGLDAGGETDNVRSAGLVVVHNLPWAIADLRVDWSETCPIQALDDLWKVWEPRMPIYLERALRPAEAPVKDVV